MLKKVIDYLNENPEVKEKFIERKICLIGLSKAEKQAVLDVFSGNTAVLSVPFYW
ncbi:competence pheromone ComX [Tepidibacillus decaturensis]|uniref:competence pheromone ComX n=1 Tax=Tepidibacillus decaturensis TaxID=1413211 RepID=UPI00128F448B|nr:competence pheromone ComX [Tepidibacillus decaturensis]